MGVVNDVLHSLLRVPSGLRTCEFQLEGGPEIKYKTYSLHLPQVACAGLDAPLTVAEVLPLAKVFILAGGLLSTILMAMIFLSMRLGHWWKGEEEVSKENYRSLNASTSEPEEFVFPRRASSNSD